MGKSTLAQALATTLGLKYARVQFTSDLLPADVLGVSIFDTETRAFRFHPGPIFHSVVLADEINARRGAGAAGSDGGAAGLAGW